MTTPRPGGGPAPAGVGSAPPDHTDLAILLALYNPPATGDTPRRPPWTWSVLEPAERDALGRVLASYVAAYNHVHAITETDLIPPCWRRHPALATELAVQVWLWYAAHRDPKATPAAAAEFYTRHLPGFRARLDHLLGRSPEDCRAGTHYDTWRKDVEDRLAALAGTPADPARDPSDLDSLAEPDFGFRARHHHP